MGSHCLLLHEMEELAICIFFFFGSRFHLPCLFLCSSYGIPKQYGNRFFHKFLQHELKKLSTEASFISFMQDFTGNTNSTKVNPVYILLVTYFGEGNGTPLQYSCLENPMDGGAW